jgi:TRAP-type C4-dicarboxylate transport system substrate-binding protein
MTQDEIIEMANKAGIVNPQMVINTLESFAKLVAEHERERFTDAAMKAAEKGIDTAITLEREACAKVCEDSVEYAGDTLAEAIRARGQA